MSHYSKRFHFNAHDAGSVVANGAIAASSYVAAAGCLDAFATEGYEQLTMEHGILPWLVQATFFVSIKVLATTLRSNGSSSSRKFVGTIFDAILRGIKAGIKPGDLSK